MADRSKDKTLDVLSTCMIRHEIDTRCRDCIYYGAACVEAHNYAYRAVKVLKQSEVANEQCKRSGVGERFGYNRHDVRM